MNPIVPTGGSAKTVIVQESSLRQECRDFVVIVSANEAKLARQDKETLVAKWELGCRLIKRKAEVGHGNWLAECQAIGISNQTANDYMRIGRLARMKLEELGSQQAAMRLVREREAEEAKSRGEEPNSGTPEFEEGEDSETDEGAAQTAPAGGTGHQGSQKPTAPSSAATNPKAGTSGQQSLPGMGKPEDAAAAKERLDKNTRRQAKSIAQKIAEAHREFQKLMRCKDARVVGEIHRLAGLSGFRIEEVAPAETAAGFESKQDSAYECWRELDAAERLLTQAAGKDT